MAPPNPGLCADCVFSRVVDSGRSVFYMCQRALRDPRFRKYPPLPVVSCWGYQRTGEGGGGGAPERQPPDDKLAK
jgi:hypothetical protein